MLDRNFILNNQDLMRQNIENRNMKVDFDLFLKLDAQRTELLQEVDDIRKQRNENTQAIKSASTEERAQFVELGKAFKQQLAELEPKLEEVEAQYKEILYQIPNITSEDAPIGKTDEDNVEVRQFGERNKFDFEPKDHLELAESLDLLDFKKAAEVSGSRFYYVKNDLVLLEHALQKYTMDLLLQKHGFIPIVTPDLARLSVIEGTGFNPRGEESQIYKIEGHDLGLIGTAEITMAGYHANEVIPVEKLPLKYVALSHCFRTEAGAYGRHSKGLYRVHQFEKIEMFVYCHPDQSHEMHELLKDIEIEIFEGLGIPFRLIDICTGDLGAPAYKKYDLEAWMYGREGELGGIQGAWGEITSTSNCLDYQARRLNTKFKGDKGTDFVHTLNGTAMVTSRVPIALLEHYQQKDGSVKIPEALQTYMGKELISPAN